MKDRKKQAKMRPQQLRCPHCGALAVIRPASEIYGNPDKPGELYVCSNYPQCKSYVGMHPGTRIPLGNLANGDLRNLRIRAHRKFDQLWQSGVMHRDTAYRWMADYFNIPMQEAHIGMFGEYRCKALIKECDRLLALRRKSAG